MANTYYASTSGTAGGEGTIGSPWDLQTALTNGSQTTGDTLYLRGGTYTGKFNSTLNGGTVRSYPNEWAILDGNLATTLTSSINSLVTTIPVASTAGMVSGGTIGIDTELMQIALVVSPTSLLVTRNWSPNIGGAASHTSGAAIYAGGTVLTHAGGAVTYRDFEIKNSSTTLRNYQSDAISGGGSNGYYSFLYGASISNPAGDGANFINLLIHDTASGPFIGSSSSNTTIYGCVIYNNGGYYFNTAAGESRGSGHGMYMENSAGYSRVYRNISINNFNASGQFYGVSGDYRGGDHQYNLFANAGAPLTGLATTNFRNNNIYYGPNSVASPTANIVNNNYFQPMNAVGGTGAYIGYGAGITALTLTGNTFVGGPSSLTMDVVSSVTASGNKFYLNSATFGYTEIFAGPSYPTGTFNSNTYYNATGQNYFGRSGVGYVDFATWKTATGYDGASTTTGSAMPDTVTVIPNEYEPGRANVVIYAASNPSSINVDLSTTGLISGQAYTIKNAFNWYGSDVATGIYNGASPIVSVPINTAATTVATPLGMANTAATTAPALIALVVTPTVAISSAANNIILKGTVTIL